MPTNRERLGHWPGVHETHFATSTGAAMRSRREIDHAVAEAARRDRERRRCGRRDQSSDDIEDAPFCLVDAFELSSSTPETSRVRVLVVERVRRHHDAPSSAELADAFGLTPREIEVARALADRLSSAEIATALGISVNTVRRHTERVLDKLGVRSRRQIRNVLRRRDENG